jgi:hypothetical protein
MSHHVIERLVRSITPPSKRTDHEAATISTWGSSVMQTPSPQDWPMWISPARSDIAYIGLGEGSGSSTRRRAKPSSGMQTPSPPDWPIWIIMDIASTVGHRLHWPGPSGRGAGFTRSTAHQGRTLSLWGNDYHPAPKSYTRSTHVSGDPWDSCAGNFARGGNGHQDGRTHPRRHRPIRPVDVETSSPARPRSGRAKLRHRVSSVSPMQSRVEVPVQP